MAKTKKAKKAKALFVTAPGLTPRLVTRAALPAAPAPRFWTEKEV